MNVGLSYIVQIMGGEDATDQANAADRQAGLSGVIRGFIAQTFRQLVAAIAAGYHTEHNTDDTHKTIHATGAVYERSRTTAIGDWTDVSFAAGNYTAAGSMTWTVTSGQQVVLAYLRIGTTLYLNFWIETSTLGGTVSTSARLALPASLVAGQYASHPIQYVNSGSGIGFARVAPGDRYLSLFKGDSSAWTAGALTIHGQMALKASDSTTVTAAAVVLTYSGAAAGSVNFSAVTTLSLTVTGTYTITVSADLTVTFKGAAGGGGGGSTAPADNVSGGGGGGGATTTGTTCALLAAHTYTLVLGAGGAAQTTGGATTFTDTTSSTTLVSLNPGVGANKITAGTGGALVTGTNGVTGGNGGAGKSDATAANAGNNATNGAGGGAGGGGTGVAGANGGNGSATGGTGGAAGVAGGNNGGLAGAGGGVGTSGGGGGGGGGGAQFTSVSGAYGGGGGGCGYPVTGTATGGAGLAGVAVLVFVSVP